MPRYHFNVYDGRSAVDDEGTELPDRETARIEAVRHAGLILQDEARHIAPGDDWRMEVTDDAGVLLYRLALSLAALPVPEPIAGRWP